LKRLETSLFFPTPLSTITPDEYFERIHRIVSLLDEENTSIIRTMKQHGPRNILHIARESKLPYTTVYSRVVKLESMGVLRTWIHPHYSKLGLARAMVYATPFAGKELLAREALRIPGYWLQFARCIGDCNGYYSQHGIPFSHQRDFELYLEQVRERGALRNFQLFWLGKPRTTIPNFDYYDMKSKTWRFDWNQWLELLSKGRGSPRSKEPAKSEGGFDAKDLIILKELSKNARRTLADMSKLLSMTLPATKYRFDDLVERGFIQDYVIDILPFAPEISQLSELRLDFRNESSLKDAREVLLTLPFVLNFSPVNGLNSLTCRIYIPRPEITNLMTLISHLAKDGILTGYHYSEIDPTTIQTQTFAYKYYDDIHGWRYENRAYLGSLDNLLSAWPSSQSRPTFLETPIAAASQ
jgi:DNA-binding Lrp family transcriptional regulator